MQKSRNATIAIIVGIFLYGLLGVFFLEVKIHSLYQNIMNPIIWITLGIALNFLLGKTFENKKLKKQIIQYTIIAVLAWIIIYMLSGLVVTFGYNPYSTTFIGVIYNLWITGSVLIAREYIRYKLINNVYDKDKIKIATLISIAYVIIDIEFNRFIGKPLVAIMLIKYFSQMILPNIAKNILFSYANIYSSCVPAIAYQLFTNLYFWISPILPNSPWIMTAIIDTTVPVLLFLYIRYSKNKLNIFRSRESIINSDPKNIIPLVAMIILAIWFALGIFPIKPVSIASGSMEKELFVGDIAFIKKCNANDVNVGDIIEYQMDGYTVIHRIKEKKQKNGEFYFITKGDNNNAPDKKEVREDQLIGKVVFKIKYLGYPAVWIHKIQEAEQIVEIDIND